MFSRQRRATKKFFLPLPVPHKSNPDYKYDQIFYNAYNSFLSLLPRSYRAVRLPRGVTTYSMPDTDCWYIIYQCNTLAFMVIDKISLLENIVVLKFSEFHPLPLFLLRFNIFSRRRSRCRAVVSQATAGLSRWPQQGHLCPLARLPRSYGFAGAFTLLVFQNLLFYIFPHHVLYKFDVALSNHLKMQLISKTKNDNPCSFLSRRLQ